MKAAVLYALGDHPLLQPRGDMDTAVYVALAKHAPAEPFFVSPLYLYFLRAAGVSLLAARIIQVILGSVAVVLIFDMARRWFGDRAAVVAAILAIGTGVISFYEITILQAALDPFLVALVLWLFCVAAPPAILGFAAGLLVLNRPNALLWIPVLVIAILWLRGWRKAVALAAGVILAIAPVTIRNYAVSHQMVLVASHGGLNFYIGNNPDADGTYHHVAGVRPTIAGQAQDAPRVEGREGSFYRRAWNWIASNPGAALALFFRKSAYTFNQTDLALNYSYAYFTHDVASPLKVLIIGPWLLFPLGLIGATRNIRDREFAAWATFIPVYALSVALFFVSSRYRLPLLIPMCVTASAMFVKPRLPQWIAAAGLAIGVCWNFGLDDGRAHERTNMAVYLIEQRRPDEAERLIDDTETITRDPNTLHLRSAEAFIATGELDRALAMLQRTDSPDGAAMARNLGITFAKSKRPQEALAAFSVARKLDPLDASNLLNMAVLEAQSGNINAAREHARAALQLRPGYPQAMGLLHALELQSPPL